jgi:cell wall-associated NlpC family hydrolase
MNKLRVISTTLIAVTLLNTGCVQEKVSKINPSTIKRTNLISNDLNKTSKTENNTSVLNHKEGNELDELLLFAKNNKSVGIDVGEESSIDNSVETISQSPIEENWVKISKEEEIILTAQEFMGAKYVWAANGPECFDCSGFTRYVYKEHGMTLPRYSGNQAKVGVKVDYTELQVGDLVFFDTEKHYRKKVNHVGIYIGDNKFIHASSAKKKVVITSFKEKRFYKNRFLWGQRVINYSNTYASL